MSSVRLASPTNEKLPMKHALVAVVAITTSLATSAQAHQWLVYTGGARPDRTFTVIDEDYISPEFNSDDRFKVEAVTVYEGADQPDWMSANYHVDCVGQTLSIDLVQISPRNGPLRRGPDVPQHEAANVTEHQILTFACDKGRKSSAQRARERDENNDPRNFIYMGPISLPRVVDAAWEKVWTDGRRPTYTSTVSVEDQNAQVEQIMRDRQELVAQAGAIAAESQSQADAITASRERHAARLRRENRIAHKLEDWIGSTEVAIRQQWGEPIDVEQSGGRVRALTFRASRSTTVHDLVAPNVVQERVQTQNCDIRLEFQDGRVIDYFSTGGLICEQIYGG